MRGICLVAAVWVLSFRFNPAYAGNMLLDKTKYSTS